MERLEINSGIVDNVVVVLRHDWVKELCLPAVILADDYLSVPEPVFQIGRAIDDTCSIDRFDFERLVRGLHTVGDADVLAITDDCDFHDSGGLLADTPH